MAQFQESSPNQKDCHENGRSCHDHWDCLCIKVTVMMKSTRQFILGRSQWSRLLHKVWEEVNKGNLLHKFWEEACKREVLTEISFDPLATRLIEPQVCPANDSAWQNLGQEDHGEDCADTQQNVEQHNQRWYLLIGRDKSQCQWKWNDANICHVCYWLYNIAQFPVILLKDWSWFLGMYAPTHLWPKPHPAVTQWRIGTVHAHKPW